MTKLIINRIKWTTGRYGIVTGRVNGQSLFYISWGASVVAGKPYALTTNLPVKLGEGRFAEDREARAWAEDILTHFVHTIGAAFPEESHDGNPHHERF